MLIHGVSTAEPRKNKNKNKNEGSKRFTDKQISFLEHMFKTESRPELRMKHQLANKLGLHPRQVAIWFQNKRARSKSRQIEQEYNMLKHNYETLASKSESLKKENEALLNQLEMLKNVAENNSGCILSDDRITNSTTKSDENVNVLVYESDAYYEQGSNFLEIEEHICSVNEWQDLQKWLEI